MDITSRFSQAKSTVLTPAPAILASPISRAAPITLNSNPVLKGSTNPLTELTYAAKNLGPQTKAPGLPTNGSASSNGMPAMPSFPGGKSGDDFGFGGHGPTGFDVENIINGHGGRPGGPGGFNPGGSSGISGDVIFGGKGDEGGPSGGPGLGVGNWSKFLPGDKGLPGTPGSHSGIVPGGSHPGTSGFIGFGQDGSSVLSQGSSGHGPNSVQGIVDRSKKGYGIDKEGDGQKLGGTIGWILAGPLGYAAGSAIGKAYDGSKADSKASTPCKDNDLQKCTDDFNREQQEAEDKKDSSGKPNPNGSSGRPDETGNGNGGGGPRANAANASFASFASSVFFPADSGNGGGTPFSSISRQYMPADDSSGGGTPRSNLFRPSDESAGGNNPHSSVASVAVKVGAKSLFTSALVQH